MRILYEQYSFLKLWNVPSLDGKDLEGAQGCHPAAHKLFSHKSIVVQSNLDKWEKVER